MILFEKENYYKIMSLGKIGILTIGGDCSGLNSVIRAAYKRASLLGYDLIGIKRGFVGFLNEQLEYITLNDSICDNSLLTTSGSILYSDTKSIEQTLQLGKTIEDVKKLILKGYSALGLVGLIYIGGDGSLYFLKELLRDEENLKVVAVPKTIDNDVEGTDFSVGFQTAVDVVADFIENITATAKSHERVMVIEVMGRDAGFLAMAAGIASGADIILVPEFKYSFDKIKENIQNCYQRGKNHCIIVASEAVDAHDFYHENINLTRRRYIGIGAHLAQKIQNEGIEARSVVLGHTQRGGKTIVADRILGSMFGVEAVNLIDQKDYGKLLCFSSGRIESIAIKDLAVENAKILTKNNIYVEIAKNLDVYIGDV